MMSVIYWIVSFVLLGVCSFLAIGKPMESGTWEGFVSFGANMSDFRPCGSRDIWWLKGKRYTDIADEMRRRYSELVDQPYERVYARLKGKISKTKGQFGPLGTYDRVFYVSEILEMRAKQEGDCEE
mgnify:CR=1 FL=1